MFTAQITLTEPERQIIQDITQHTGKTLDQVLHEAVTQFIARSPVRDRQALLRQARGMWKDREDLSDLAPLRQEWDRFELK